mmetsp:Transcript_5997/g.10992  ORF Transcript_5997/g.10992 Transcript_5997/m.10992 type:complete len:180 (+) Transcript_5997:155-694(+)
MAALRGGVTATTTIMKDLVKAVAPCWLLKGTVIQGFGRGSKELGIPTANIDAKCLKEVEEKLVQDNGGNNNEMVSGIYCGFASKGSESQVYPMVMSIGWNPFYKNKERTCEPWILHDFESDFYGEELRLLVCGYIRSEQNFTSLEDLIARIHEDARVTKEVLREKNFSKLSEHAFLQPA